MSAFLERYATFANFGGGTVAVELPREPHILNITCPDTIKRRLPTKHYVSLPAVTPGDGLRAWDGSSFLCRWVGGYWTLHAVVALLW